MENLREFEPWIGSDADLETSLLEYGLVMRKAINPGTNKYEYQAIIRYSDEMFIIIGIDSGYIAEKIGDITTWSNWQSFLDFTGFEDLEEFTSCTLILQIDNLLTFFGFEEIFGGGSNFGHDFQSIPMIQERFPEIFA